MSLEELKRENEGATEESQDLPDLEQEEVAESAEEPVDEEVESEGSEEAEEPTEETAEAWMLGDDQTSQSSETVPTEQLVKMRQKLKGKVRERDDEIEKLKAQIESLSQGAQAPASAAPGKPKRDDFLDAEDPDEAYMEAYFQWRGAEEAKKNHANTVRKQQEAQDAELKARVDAHYEEAQGLLDKHGLDATVYQSADNGLRQVVDAAFPGEGDVMTDRLISQIGEGSAKLVMYVGNSAERKSQLQASLTSDKSGLSAMRLIGRWESEMIEPTKKQSKAPAPAKRAAPGEPKDPSSVLHKKYKDAHKNGDAQKAFNIKQEAKKQKLDISNW